MRYFLQLTENKLEFKTAADLKGLEENLTNIILELLNTDLNQLMSALYKIDISEQIFKNIISNAPPKKIAPLLAQEIIKRELQKMETREKYRDYFK